MCFFKRIFSIIAIAISLFLINNSVLAAPTVSKKVMQHAQVQVKPVAGAQLQGLRAGTTAKAARLVMDLSSARKYKFTKENNNMRLVVTLDDVGTALKQAPKLSAPTVKGVILANYGTTVQLIVDLKVPVEAKVYALSNPHRIVMDIPVEYEEEGMTEPAPGLLYGRYMRVDSRGMMTCYMLDVDPKLYSVGMALAGGDVSSGLRTTSSIAKANNAVAAVNGGFFEWDGKSLVGCTRLGGLTAGTTYFSRSSLGIMPDGQVKIEKADYYGQVDIGKHSVVLSGVNCPRGKDGIVMYNKLYGARTETNEFGTEYIIRGGRVIEIGKGNAAIPEDGFVLSAHGEAQKLLSDVKAGDRALLGESFGALDGAREIYGAGPELVRDGQLHVTTKEESFESIDYTRAPRTAMGFKGNGHVFLLVVDGRQSHSIGATLNETGELLLRYGVKQGFNLDGGGSSTMFVAGSVVNSPSSGGERRVANAMIVTRK